MSRAIDYPRITPVFTPTIIIAVVVNAMTYLGPKHSLSQFNALGMSKTLRVIPHKRAIPAWAGPGSAKPKAGWTPLPRGWSTGDLWRAALTEATQHEPSELKRDHKVGRQYF